jgi:hypothetical protein
LCPHASSRRERDAGGQPVYVCNDCDRTLEPVLARAAHEIGMREAARLTAADRLKAQRRPAPPATVTSIRRRRRDA